VIGGKVFHRARREFAVPIRGCIVPVLLLVVQQIPSPVQIMIPAAGLIGERECVQHHAGVPYIWPVTRVVIAGVFVHLNPIGIRQLQEPIGITDQRGNPIQESLVSEVIGRRELVVGNDARSRIHSRIKVVPCWMK
jgi:hypothetical protein